MSTTVKRAIHIRAIKVAIVVGTILGAINYADKLIIGSMVPTDWVKLGLTYMVPYCVSMYSALAARKG